MRSVFVAAFLLLVFQGAHSEDVHEWFAAVIKQAEPNELAFLAMAAPDCPITTEEIEEITKGVLVRSRIKPLGDPQWIKKDVFLQVVLWCQPIPNGNPIYNLEVNFGKANSGALISYNYPFGRFGMNSADNIREIIKDSVEGAITVYLEANFDLGDRSAPSRPF